MTRPERTVHMYDIRACKSTKRKAKLAARWLRETAMRKRVRGESKPDTSMLACADAIDDLLTLMKEEAA